MTYLDLAQRENWELLLSERRIAVKHDKPVRKNSLYEYTPISPIYATPRSRLLLIGTQSDSAEPRWFLGARASQYLYVSPSMTTAYVSGVQAADIKSIGLNRMTLVEFKDYGVSPYVLQLAIPYWLEDISVEVWEYQGYIPIDADNSEILDRLDAIEDKLDALENYGT